jgi:hypothetical protein
LTIQLALVSSNHLKVIFILFIFLKTCFSCYLSTFLPGGIFGPAFIMTLRVRPERFRTGSEELKKNGDSANKNRWDRGGVRPDAMWRFPQRLNSGAVSL